LLTLAADRDRWVRGAAAEALAGRKGAEVTAALLSLATNSNDRRAHRGLAAAAVRRCVVAGNLIRALSSPAVAGGMVYSGSDDSKGPCPNATGS
jgi:hypothetical protein